MNVVLPHGPPAKVHTISPFRDPPSTIVQFSLKGILCPHRVGGIGAVPKGAVLWNGGVMCAKMNLSIPVRPGNMKQCSCPSVHGKGVSGVSKAGRSYTAPEQSAGTLVVRVQ